MKRSAKYLAVCTAAVMTVSATAGMSVMASEDKAFSIDMTNNTDEMWAGLAMTNDECRQIQEPISRTAARRKW